MSWPDDADGDVFRKLDARHFDFNETYLIDFNVDFEVWPPDPRAVGTLSRRYGSVEAYPPDGESEGYLLVRIQHKLEYQFVVDTQRRLSELMHSFGGHCESWGVFVP